MLKVLDLFSGIGGMTLALERLGMRTTAYCEIHPWSRAVLASNMRKGRLPQAPVFEDVRTLRARDCGPIDVIAAGFPCQGLSQVGQHAGLLDDARSSLILEVLRLVADTLPSYIFLENTPMITRDPAYPKLLTWLLDHDFQVSFMHLSAGQVGARHERNRWFLLARARGAKGLRIPSHSDLGAALATRLRRITMPRPAHAPLCEKAISYLFGNSVVPAQAFRAFQELYKVLKLFRSQRAILEHMPLSSVLRMTLRKPVVMLSRTTVGRVAVDHEDQEPSRRCQGPSRSEDKYVLRPSATLSAGRTTRPLLTRPLVRSCLPTLRASPSCCTSSRRITRRTADDPGTAVLNTENLFRANGQRPPTPKELERVMVSDHFWAQAFGFPQDWVRPLLRALGTAGRSDAF